MNYKLEIMESDSGIEVIIVNEVSGYKSSKIKSVDREDVKLIKNWAKKQSETIEESYREMLQELNNKAK